MKKALLAAMAVVLVAGFSGCFLFPGGYDYYPAAVGDKATMETVMHDSTYVVATEESTVHDSTWTTSSECIAETTLEDETEVWEFENQDGALSYMGFDKDADEVNFYSDKTDSATVTTWPLTLEVGTTWTLGDIEYEVVGNEDAGDYTGCLKVQMTPPAVEGVTYEGYMWMDKKHGTVKSWYKMVTESEYMYMEVEATTELTEFVEG